MVSKVWVTLSLSLVSFYCALNVNIGIQKLHVKSHHDLVIMDIFSLLMVEVKWSELVTVKYICYDSNTLGFDDNKQHMVVHN